MMYLGNSKRFLLVWLIVLTIAVPWFAFSPGLFMAYAGYGPSKPEAPENSPFTVYLPITIKNLTSRTIFGIDLNDKSDAAINKLKEANASWARRYAIKWASVEQVEGQYDWKALEWLDNLSLQANANGFTLLPIVSQTPDWAQQIAGYPCGPIKADKLYAFGEFMYQLVLRYSYPPYNVLYYQIWNEPDVDYRWAPSPDTPFGCWGNNDEPNYYGGEYYADVLKVIYPRVKAANPQAQVVIGGLLMGCNPNLPLYCTYHQSKYLEGILYHYGDMDGKNYFDAVAFHAYSDYNGNFGQYVNGGWYALWNNVGPVVIEKARFIKQVLANYGAYNKKLFATEIALRCGPGEQAPSCLAYDENFEITKAYYLAQAYAASIAEGLEAAIWFDLSGTWRRVALLNTDLTNRYAYLAFKVARNSLKSGEFIGEVTEYAGTKGYKFWVDGYEVWLLWSLDGNAHQITLPKTPVSSWDVLGAPLGYGSTFTLTISPVYLRFSP